MFFRKRWNIVGSAVRGTYHEKINRPCQDFFSSFRSSDLTIICLADGAGVYEHSKLGAKKSCEFLIEYFKDNHKLIFNNDLKVFKQVFIVEIQQLLLDFAMQLNIDYKELSSTLLFTVVYKNDYMVGHIGDGVIGAFNSDSLTVLSEPENGEFINQTYFTTSENCLSHFRINSYKFKNNQPLGFIIMSDGTAESLYDRKKNVFSHGVLKLFYWMSNTKTREMKNLLTENQKKIFRKKTHDDCSIVLMMEG